MKITTIVSLLICAFAASGCAADTNKRLNPSQSYGYAIPQTSSVGRPVYHDPVHDCQRSVYDTHGVACAGN